MVSPATDPAIVVLIGAAAAGKSTWARQRFRADEIASSDDLRAVVGSGRGDLDASTDAFRLLDDIVAARARRTLTCVIDTLGLDPERRRGYLDTARRHGLRAVAVVFETPAPLVRERNRRRDRAVPAPVLAAQLTRSAQVRAEVEIEGWDEIVIVGPDRERAELDAGPGVGPDLTRSSGPPEQFGFVLQLSRFPWGADPAGWLKSMALAAAEAGFSGIALMDHLIQIPQVDRAWSPIPEPWVTLGLLAGLDTELRLGTLVSPVTFRPPGVTAKVVATLDTLSGGRAFLGLGAGWWEREHLAFGLPFPPAADRLDGLERAIETIRALWAAGTKAFDGELVSLPETTCYPRPLAPVPIIVGGGGERRTLRIAARLGDGCNLPSELGALERKIDILHRYCAEVGRDRADVKITVLDVAVVGDDRDQVWQRVERLRGRTAAAAYARTHHAATLIEQRDRYQRLAERGVTTVFLALPHVHSADDLLALAPMLR